ncbi:MAG: EutN/CcmL family microcompartment protein [Lachnospiraceae bacterium]|jgi:microcompartment protein CcmK/EutM|nr:EutN/CcmL family microcompartment protein [Lachnospiraceae bacterium]
MRIGRVTGNMTSVIHDPSHEGYKFLTVRFVNAEGQEEDAEAVFADAAQAGIGDLVLVCEDGGAAGMVFALEGSVCVLDGVIVGVIDR